MSPDPIATTYNPKYVALDDVPLSGPDTDYSDTDKRKALFQAESSLELDVNNGKQIPDRKVEVGHKAAVMNLATHVLTHAAEEPQNASLGDMADSGSQITQYSSRYLDEYKRLATQLEAITGGSSDNFSYAVNSGSDRAEGAEYQTYSTSEGTSGPQT